MGNDMSIMSGGGRNKEAWGEACVRRVKHELPSPHPIPLVHGGYRMLPALLLDGELRSTADDKSSASSSRSVVTPSTYSTEHSVLSRANQNLRSQHRGRRMLLSDVTSATNLPAAAAPTQQQQPQKHTQYSMYAREMRRRVRDGGRFSLGHRNSGVDFMVANEFFSCSDSTVGSEADLDSSRGSLSSSSTDIENYPGRAYNRRGMTPMEPTLPRRSGRPLSRRRARDELFEHPLRHELNGVDGVPPIVLSSMPTAATSATSPLYAKSSSTGRAKTTTAKTVAVVVSGVDGGSDPPPALTSSRNSSHNSKSSASSRKESNAAPTSSARPSSWRKRLLWPTSQSDTHGSGNGSPTKRGSSHAAGGALSAHEEKKSKADAKKMREKGCDFERPWQQKQHPHRTRSSVAAAQASSETAGAAATSTNVEALAAETEVPITNESLRVMDNTELCELDFSAQKARRITSSQQRNTHADMKRQHTRSGGVFGGEYGSFMCVSMSPAQQHHATSEDDRGRCSANCVACLPRWSESRVYQCSGISSHHSGSSSSSTHHHNHPVRHHHSGGDDGSNGIPGTALARLVDSRRHHNQLNYTNSTGGWQDLSSASSNDFFASEQQSRQHRMLYGMNGNLHRSGRRSCDDEDDDLNSESESSTASMREAAHLATGGGEAVAHSFGSLFAGLQAASLQSVASPSPGQPCIEHFADGRLMESTTAMDYSAPTVQKTYDGSGKRKASRRPSTPGPHCSGRGVASVMPESSQDARHSPISVVPMPASVVAAEVPDNRKQVDTPGVICGALLAGAPCRGDHDHVHAIANVSRCGSDHSSRGSDSSEFDFSSSRNSSISPDVSLRGFVRSSRGKSPAKEVSPLLLPQPPTPQTAVARAEAPSFHRRRGGDGSTNLSSTECAMASVPTLKGCSGGTRRRRHHGNVGNSGKGAVQTTTSVLTSDQGSSNALRPTRADSKDLILRPDRTTSTRRHRIGGDDDAPGGSGSRQRRPRNRTHSSNMRLSSFSFSSDSFLYGKLRGRLAKAAAVAANSHSTDRRHRASGSGGCEGTQAYVRHHIHGKDDSVASEASQSASVRKGETESRPGGRHHRSSRHHRHKRHGVSTSSDQKREMRSRSHLRSKHGSGSEMGSMVAGLDDLLLGDGSRGAAGNLTSLYRRSVSSSLSSLAPSSRNSSVNGGVGGSGSGVGSSSVRVLRKRAAKARDLSTSSSVDSEANGCPHPHWSVPPSASQQQQQHPLNDHMQLSQRNSGPHQQQQQRRAAGATAAALPRHHLSLTTASNSSGDTVAASGSANGAATGGAYDTKTPPFTPSMGVDISSSTDLSTDRPANGGGYRLTSEYNTVMHPHHLAQQQQRVAIMTTHDLIGKGHSSNSNYLLQPLRSLAAASSATMAAAPEMHNVVPSHSTSSGGARLLRMPLSRSPRHANSKSDGEIDSATVSFPGINGRGDGGSGAAAPSSVAALLSGPARDSSTRRRRPTTQNFTPLFVDMSRFKALHEALESSS
ncbi:hypothetical protein, conserved [Leishmania lindenbergi]|uniref:Uncharacterized protein n=1 Tax=Leishmania lindenbergi TaxID=651832 RepID=A0AAW3AXF9_9TRYP